MSGRPSGATEEAVRQFRLTIKSFRHNRVRITAAVRLQAVKDLAVLAGIHYTTLARALGIYKGKLNGNGRRAARKRG